MIQTKKELIVILVALVVCMMMLAILYVYGIRVASDGPTSHELLGVTYILKL